MTTRKASTKTETALARPTDKKPATRSRGRVRTEGSEVAEFPVPPLASEMPTEYPAVLADLKQHIVIAQVRAARSASRELIELYFYIGAVIASRQKHADWGKSVVERLAFDLRAAFPGMAGFSARNVWRMRAFFVAWTESIDFLPQAVAEIAESEGPPDSAGEMPTDDFLPQAVAEIGVPNFLPQAVAELPWGHNIMLIEQVKSPDARFWYAEQARAASWSRATLGKHIEKDAYSRQGKATTNFERVLPPPQGSTAHQVLKDPYLFDFLTVERDAHERVLERELLAHIRDFLLELGAGFAFLGSQVKLVVDNKDYYLDLLFYHTHLRAHVVVDLKSGAFKPADVGQMNFYLSAVDDLLKHPDDQPSIGLLLCKSRSRLHVEYALRRTVGPIGVAEYRTTLTEGLPKELEGSLPTIEQLEAELMMRSRGRR